MNGMGASGLWKWMTQESQEGVVDDSMVHAYQSVPSKTEGIIPLNRVGITAHIIAVFRPNVMSSGGHFATDTCLPTDGDGPETDDEAKIKMMCQGDAGTQREENVMTTEMMGHDKKDDAENATVAPSMGRDIMKPTGKDKVFQVIDTSFLGNTAHSEGDIPAVTDPCHAQTTQDITNTQGSPDKMSNSMVNDVGTSLSARMTRGERCHHSKGGVCTIHGPGAVLRWKPAGTKVVRVENGMKKTTSTRDYYYVCDLGPLGSGKKMKQTRLSFTVMKTTKSDEDDNERGFKGEPSQNQLLRRGNTTLYDEY